MERMGTHFDRHEDNADGAERCLGWCETHHILRDIHGIDCGVQGGENAATAYRSLELWPGHGRGA